MNGIEKITERIVSDADREAREILDRARSQAAEIRASYEALSDAEYADAVEQGKADAAERIERRRSVSELAARQKKLAARQEMLDRAFELARKKLLSLPEEDYVRLLAKLAVQGSETGDEALVLSRRDRPIYGKRVVLAANAMLEEAGRSAALTLSEESRDFEGGLYVLRGRVETNCTFPTLLRMLRTGMAREVADILFD